jgi:hypothetical protein
MFSTDNEFEDECRRVARLLWPAAEFGGAAMVDDRERDGIFETQEFVHCIECTTGRSKLKAQEDCEKLEKLIRKLKVKHPDRFIKGWFITLAEPTADQRSISDAYRPQIVACSYAQFKQRVIDANSYIEARRNYAFGSVRDPGTGAVQFDLKYIEVELLSESGESFDSKRLAERLDAGECVILTGDYGAGKSSTAREVFFDLSRRYWKSEGRRFPVLLNLRDHHGQQDPVEALERHARNVGFGSPSSLVRAWRAGFCILILDGFDEVASAGWAGSVKKLRDLRFRSMELIRRFVRESPSNIGLLITGRQHFFDSESELRQSLNLGPKITRLKLSELTNDNIGGVLSAFGWKGEIPEWLPTRPLLLSEPRRLSRRLQPERGWSLWEQQSGIRRKYGSERYG